MQHVQLQAPEAGGRTLASRESAENVRGGRATLSAAESSRIERSGMHSA